VTSGGNNLRDFLRIKRSHFVHFKQ